MTVDEQRGLWAELMGWAQDARVRSATYAAQAAAAAETATAIGEQVDRMMERVAERNPEYAGRLHAIIAATASQRAVITESKRSWPGGQPLPRAQNEPEAAASTESQGHLRDMAVLQGRDRPVGEFQDNVIQRVFTAGLTLQDAAELTTEPEVRWRIEAAADDLDGLIRVIRGALFNPADRPPSCEPDDLTPPARDW